MSDRYLWDGSGEPDPEIQKLEEALAPLGHRAWPAAPPSWTAPPGPAAHARSSRMAAAAVLLAMLGVASSLAHRGRTSPVAGPTRGEVFETDARSHATLEMGGIGTVEVRPSTRLRLIERGRDRYRLALDRGSLRAVIVAPPGEFLVETPSARAVDLGCIYTLSVDDTGAGLLTVETGWVALEHRGRESFVPAGAQCATRPGRGPGLPYYLDAPASFRAALESPAGRAALAAALAQARPRDAMTLWHLLARAARGDRALVFDRLAALVPPPAGVVRESVLGGDPASLDAWWNELGLGSVDFWRAWKAAWPAR